VGQDIPNHQSLILRTTNAGESWSPVVHPYKDNNILSYIYFINAQEGWVTGNSSNFLHTMDGGETWTEEFPGIPGAYYSVFGIDPDTAWIGALGAYFLRTVNGFSTVQQTSVAIKSNPWDMYFLNADTGFAVLGWCPTCQWDQQADMGGYLLRTSNGGADWTVQQEDTTKWGYYGLSFVNDSVGYISGSEGTVLRTSDGGLTWSQQTTGTTYDFWSLYFINADTGYVVGGNSSITAGIILQTKDGGNSWAEIDTLNQAFLSNVFFIDNCTGWAVGEMGTIISTKDCGKTWEKALALTVVVSPLDGGTVSGNPAGTLFKFGTVVELVALPNPDYRFTGWSTGEEEDTIRVTMESSQLIYANFELIPDALERPGSSDQANPAIRLYPNPAGSNLIIEFTKETTALTSIALFDYTGQLLYAERIDPVSSSEHTMDLSNLQEGVYFIRISNKDFSLTKKITKVE
jgi:photosystem II stability/assembly factor-like uncharacterized protein